MSLYECVCLLVCLCPHVCTSDLGLVACRLWETWRTGNVLNRGLFLKLKAKNIKLRQNYQHMEAVKK